MSQSASPSTTRSALIGASVVAVGAGAGGAIGYVKEDSGFKGLAALGGALTGAAFAGLGGLVVAVASKKYRKPALATAAVGIGGIAALVVGNAVYRGLASGQAPSPQVGPPAPGPGSNIAWTSIPMSSTLQPQVVYRISDTASVAELASPPSQATVQSTLGPAFQVDSVATGSPPAGWVPADTGTGRVYVEFFVTSQAQLPTGFTSAARLYAQKANA